LKTQPALSEARSIGILDGAFYSIFNFLFCGLLAVRIALPCVADWPKTRRVASFERM
jgi:hypothetical protein